MKRLLVWIIASLALTVIPAAAEKKVALVVGNSEYRHATPLPNPTRDAEAMAAMLKGIGFEVIAGTDLDRQGMADKIREFSAKADGAETVLYFYAGHGLQVGGQNYLIPVDADLNTEMDVKFNTLDIDLMLQQTPASAKVKLVLLDACRNNPFQEQLARFMSAGKTRAVQLGKGLAEMKPTFGTLIAYATGPGEVALDGKGKNSPFTSALVKYLAEPGLEIGQAMTRVRAEVYENTGNQQLPWENKNLTSDYFLLPAAEADEPKQVASLNPEPVEPAVDEKPSSWTKDNGELVLWQAVKDSTDPTELQAYLDQYGDRGVFALSARKRLTALEAKAAEPEAKAEEPAAEAAVEETAAEPEKKPGFTPDPAIVTAEASLVTESTLDLGKTDKKIVHIKLSALGFGSRSLGNDFDEQSRMAIAKWQAARGYPTTGYLNRFQYDALLNDDAEEIAVEPEPQYDPQNKSVTRKPVYKVKPVYRAEPKPVYKKPVYRAEPKPVYKKPVFKAEPKPVIRRPAKKIIAAKPVVRKRKIVAAQPVQKRRRASGGPVPKIHINIGSGGGIGFGFGF